MTKKLFGGSSSKSEAKTPTGFESLPQFARDELEDIVGRASELSLDPSLFAQAPLTGTQQSALSSLSAGIDPTSATEFASGLETFYNPFEEQVVQNAIGDILEEGAGLQSDISSLASAAGGFGGTRQALLESELIEDILGAVGDVSASTRSAGFENAANRVLSDIARGQTVAGNVFQLGDLERQIATSQLQSPLQALEYLTNIVGAVPVGGGSTSFSKSSGETGIVPGIADLMSAAPTPMPA